MKDSVQHSKRRWPWFVVGMLVGLPILPAIDSAIRRHRPKYVLTQDLDLSAVYAFRHGDDPDDPPVRGTILAGTEFTVVMQKGNVWYISLGTAVEHEMVEALVKLKEK